MPGDRETDLERRERMREEARHRVHERTGGRMTVAEAGHKGGQRVRELIKEGERVEDEKSNR